MMIDKSNLDSRLKRAKKISEGTDNLTDKNKINKYIKACLDQLCTLKGYNGTHIKYSFPKPNPNESLAKFRREMKMADGELFFIEFSSGGHIVVAGAGYDFGFPENDRYLNWKILNSLKQKGAPILNEYQHKNYDSEFYAKELNQALLCKHLKT